MSIPVFKPLIKRKEMDGVLSCMVADSVGPGAQTREFVSELSQHLVLAGGIALREYHRAVDFVLDLMDFPPGYRVVMSPLSPRAWFEACTARGLKPVFADVEPGSACMSLESVRGLVEGQGCAVMAHHTLGYVMDMEGLKDLNVPVIEDISQSLGAKTEAKFLGNYGNYTLMSCEQENVITTGGGAVVLAQGKKELTHLKKRAELLPPDAIMPNLNAILGTMQLRRLEKILLARKEIGTAFTRSVMKCRHRPLLQGGERENVFFSFPVLVESGVKEITQYARKKGIDTQAAFADAAILASDAVADGSNAAGAAAADGAHCQNARALLLRTVLFPLYPAMGGKSVDQIARVLATLP